MTSAPPPAAPPPLPPAMEPPPWPPSPAQPARPQLRRSRTDKVLGGVNGGLAEYSGIDALLWRVGFVALTLAAGTGVIVYLLLWVLMPAGPPAPAGAPGAPGSAVQKQPAGPRSPVPRLTIAALLIVVGILAMIARFSGWDVGPRAILGAALLVVGLGLVAAAFSGGRTARGGLIALGVVLSLALVAVSTVDSRISGGVGDRTYRPATLTELRDVYRSGVGDTTIDLSRLDQGISGRGLEVRVEHGVGDLDVIVPRSADVQLAGDHGLGDVEVFDGGSVTDGFFPGEGTRPWSDDGRAEFLITINAGVGDVEVSRG